jgi:BirA family biotin operon repressor/biotin-[acetyl-CoA-carboxylase] ligase
VLRSLRAVPAGGWEKKALARDAGIDEPTLGAVTDELQADGWKLHERNGYVLFVEEPAWLNPDAIQRHLETRWFGREIVVYQETGSTNDRVRQAAEGGATEGLAVFAESQTAGRGQHGRRWVSPLGAGLWFSVLLRSNIPRLEHPLILQAAALATAEALDPYLRLRATLKPPNDLYLDGAKLAGFLLESNTGRYEVLGFGLNVHAAPEIPGARTTWAEQYASQPLNRARLAAEILNRFEVCYLTWKPAVLAEKVKDRLWWTTKARPDDPGYAKTL